MFHTENASLLKLLFLPCAIAGLPLGRSQKTKTLLCKCHESSRWTSRQRTDPYVQSGMKGTWGVVGETGVKPRKGGGEGGLARANPAQIVEPSPRDAFRKDSYTLDYGDFIHDQAGE